MPTRPLRPCAHPGCPTLVAQGRCPRHERAQADTARASDHARGSATARGYDGRWRAYRRRYLREHPLCADCERAGRVTAATVVDHIVPHRGDAVRFWDERNHQALCQPCHSAKTARSDGGFGNRSRR